MQFIFFFKLIKQEKDENKKQTGPTSIQIFEKKKHQRKLKTSFSVSPHQMKPCKDLSKDLRKWT